MAELERLRAIIAKGEAQIESGDFITLDDDAAIDAFFTSLRRPDSKDLDRG